MGWKRLVKMAPSIFGYERKIADLPIDRSDREESPNLICVCINYGTGWVPKHICLPHQLSEEKIRDYETTQGVEEVVVFPIRSKDVIKVSVKK